MIPRQTYEAAVSALLKIQKRKIDTDLRSSPRVSVVRYNPLDAQMLSAAIGVNESEIEPSKIEAAIKAVGINGTGVNSAHLYKQMARGKQMAQAARAQSPAARLNTVARLNQSSAQLPQYGPRFTQRFGLN